MQILNWQTLDSSARGAALARPRSSQDPQIRAQAAAIVEAIRREGDAGLRRLTRELDGAELGELRVSVAELAAARAALPPAQRAALERAIDNVTRFHAAQRPNALSIETQPGVHCESLIRPLRAVGLYVPAGSAPLPSAVIMLAVPARLAGCAERVLCTPPRRDGSAHPAILAAAALCGIEEIYKIGGAQAIAAMAYGTETVPKVAKIFGPGNAWVTAAKQLVAEDPEGAALDMPAGPSEVMVIADDEADAGFIASDLLAQAEHGPDSQAILLSDSAPLIAAVAVQIRAQQAKLSRQRILESSVAAMRLIQVADLASAVELCERYAPEHLLIQTRAPRALLEHIHSAGSVFLGRWSPEPMGDYCSGPNHVLPTYGYARAYSGLAVADFVRHMSVQELSIAGLQALGPVAATLAGMEGLDAHAAAVSRRLESLAQGIAS
jgi:histidinol dehydrogenase